MEEWGEVVEGGVVEERVPVGGGSGARAGSWCRGWVGNVRWARGWGWRCEGWEGDLAVKAEVRGLGNGQSAGCGWGRCVSATAPGVGCMYPAAYGWVHRLRFEGVPSKKGLESPKRHRHSSSDAGA